MMGVLTAIWVAITGGNIWATGGAIALIVSFLFKKFVTEKAWDRLGDSIEEVFFVIGSFITIALNKVTKGLWNKIIEPTFELLLKIVFNRALIGLQRGLDSDDEPG